MWQVVTRILPTDPLWDLSYQKEKAAFSKLRTFDASSIFQ